MKILLYSSLLIYFLLNGNILTSSESLENTLETFPLYKNLYKKNKKQTFVFSISWSTSNLLAAGTSDGNINIFPVDRRGIISPRIKFQATHGKIVEAISWSPNGKYLASGADVSGTNQKGLKIWHYNSFGSTLKLNQIYEFDTQGCVDCIDWYDNYILATGSINTDQQICIWDLTQKIKAEPFCIKYRNIVEVIKWHPEKKLLACGSLSKKGQLSIWEIDNSSKVIQQVSKRNITHEVMSLEWSPDGKYLATTNSQGILTIWKCFSDGKLSRKPVFVKDYGDNNNIYLSWSPRGMLAIGAETRGNLEVFVLNASAKFKLTYKTTVPSQIQAITWNPAGTMIATVNKNNALGIWKLNRSHKSLNLICEHSID